MSGGPSTPNHLLSEIWSADVPSVCTKEPFLKHESPVEATEANESWRTKMKTVGVGMAVCLNIGVDPPGTVKASPFPTLQCWTDPTTMPPAKALEVIGKRLQEQYECWQSKVRFRQCLDPTVEEFRKMCSALRRSAKDDRVLFHYNGHGVPQPTGIGELWVFNKSFTQYVPISVYDLQTWLGSPSVLVFDCPSAGTLVESFIQSISTREKNAENDDISFRDSILLASCSAGQRLPQNHLLPADLFTSCLTTPIATGLRWFCTGKHLNSYSIDLADKVPGRLNDRKTLLGELNWIFVAVTDTIAWTSLSPDLFQRLFRQDLLLSSLFRNYLLAQRIFRAERRNTVSWPRLPSLHRHPMWKVWDFAVERCLAQVPLLLENPERPLTSNPFFEENLTAFAVWLDCASDKKTPPEQLPILLQVLLSQTHRLWALRLVSRFLDLGPWAVNMVLSVGYFQYVLKLLQSPVLEIRVVLLIVWVKILGVLKSGRADIIKEGGQTPILDLLQNSSLPTHQRALAATVLSLLVHENPEGQIACLSSRALPSLVRQFASPDATLRRRSVLCLAELWHGCEEAKWAAFRESALDTLHLLFQDSNPAVRAAAIYAMTTYVSDLPDDLPLAVPTVLYALRLCDDGCPLVRAEVVVLLAKLLPNLKRPTAVGAMTPAEPPPSPTLQSLSSSPSGPASPATGQSASEIHRAALYALNVLRRDTFPLSRSAQVVYARFNTVVRRRSLESPSRPPQLALHSSLRARRINLSSQFENAGSTLSVSPERASCAGGETSPSAAAAARAEASPRMSPRRVLSTIALNLTKSRPEAAPAPSPRTPLLKSLSWFRSSTPPPSPGAGPTPSLPTTPSGERSPVYEEGDIPDFDCIESTLFTRFLAEMRGQILDENQLDDEDQVAAAARLASQQQLRTMHTTKLRHIPFRLNEQTTVLDNNPHGAGLLAFHPHHPLLLVTDHDGSCSTWNIESGKRLSRVPVVHHSFTITAMSLLPEVDFGLGLLVTGASDGFIRVHKRYPFNDQAKMVSAFYAIPQQRRSPSNSLLFHLQNARHHLYASCDRPLINVWDLHCNACVGSVSTGEGEAFVCTMDSPREGQPLLAAGLSDGSLRLYDMRRPKGNCIVAHMSGHERQILSSTLLDRNGGEMTSIETGTVVTGSVDGVVKLWDLRQQAPYHSFSSCGDKDKGDVSSIVAHASAPAIAVGSLQENVKTFNFNGELQNLIRYHDDFLGQSIGPVSSLVFHPYKALLAIAATDSMISLFSSS